MVSGGAHPRYNVIDGQQRLTTLQLFVKALHLYAAKDSHWAAGEFERLYRNPPRAHVGPEEVYKVWPTNSDRQAFQSIMELKDWEEFRVKFKNSSTRISDAFSFFGDALSAFLTGSEEEQEEEFTQIASELACTRFR